jgi:sortase A
MADRRLRPPPPVTGVGRAGTPPRLPAGARALRATGSTFIVLGLSILFFVVYELVGTSAVTRARQADLQADFDLGLAEATALPSPFGGTLPIPERSPAPRRRSAVPGIARIRIPKIGVNAIVVEGVTLERLAYGPGHYPTTKRFGEPGAAGIAGHRTGWGAPFFNLDRLRPGDTVIIETKAAVYTYRVTDSVVVHPNQSEVLDGNPRSRAVSQLVLTTCTPKFTARDRLVVFADLVRAEPRA